MVVCIATAGHSTWFTHVSALIASLVRRRITTLSLMRPRSHCFLGLPTVTVRHYYSLGRQVLERRTRLGVFWNDSLQTCLRLVLRAGQSLCSATSLRAPSA